MCHMSPELSEKRKLVPIILDPRNRFLRIRAPIQAWPRSSQRLMATESEGVRCSRVRMWPSGHFQDTPTWDPFLCPREGGAVTMVMTLGSLSGGTFPQLRRGTKAPSVATSRWSQGPQGSGDSGAGTAPSRPSLHRGTQLSCTVPWAPRAVPLVTRATCFCHQSWPRVLLTPGHRCPPWERK